MTTQEEEVAQHESRLYVYPNNLPHQFIFLNLHIYTSTVRLAGCVKNSSTVCTPHSSSIPEPGRVSSHNPFLILKGL